MTNEYNDQKELMADQISAIARAINLGRTLQEAMPEVADLYRKGSSLMDIVESKKIMSRFGIPSLSVARNAVMYALNGYPGTYSFKEIKRDSYDGLISQSELEMLAEEHLSENGRTCGNLFGKINYKNKTGIGGMTKKELSKAGQKGYGKGIGQLSPEKRKEIGRNSALARGNISYGDEEEQTIRLYMDQSRFIYQNGLYKGRFNCKLLADELNNQFHEGNEIRTPGSIKYRLYRLKTKKKIKKHNLKHH